MKDYKEFADKPLSWPINGKVYTLPPLGIEAGLILAGAIDGKDKTLAKRPPEYLWKLLLGPAWDQMVKDRVPLAAATRAGVSAFAYYQYGRAAAEAAWEAGADPKALAAYMASTPPNRASRRSKNTAGVKKTR